MPMPWRIATQFCSVTDPATQGPLWRIEFYTDENNSQTAIMRVIPFDTTKSVIEISFNTSGTMIGQSSYPQNVAGPAVPSDEVQPPT